MSDKTRSGAPIGVRRYTTDDLPPADRYEAWSKRGWPSIAPAYETVPIGQFGNSSEVFALGSLDLYYTTMSGQHYKRTTELLKADQVDALAVCVMLEGVAEGEAGGRTFHAGAGTVQFYDMAQESRHESTASRVVYFTLPRALAESLLPVRELHGVVLRSSKAAMLISHLLRLREAMPELTIGQGPRLAQTVIDLLAIAAENSGGEQSISARAHDKAALRAAQEEIERRLGSPTLTVAYLCRKLQISRSSLYRLFEAHEGIRDYIRGRRLEQVRLALSDARNGERIGSLAERWGFSDAAHLSRLFRAKYGMTPSEFRAVTLASTNQGRSAGS
ncbi:helix-turn-helix domain-containing protein [soil metagenome]